MTEHETDVMTEVVERIVDLDAAMDELWRMISDADELATWLADDVDVEVTPGASGTIVDDDVTYDVEIDEVLDGERVVWRWSPADASPDDDASSSRVELVIEPTPNGGRLTIIETRPAAPIASMLLGTSIDGQPSGEPAMGFRWEMRAGLASMRAGLRVPA